MAASEQDLDGIFNVGTGVETSVNALYEALSKAVGITAPADHGPHKAGEQMRSVLDGTKLRKAAGLPEPVTLEEGLRQTVAWLRSSAG
jgi:UDP-glucose 4-epimerase